MKKTFAKMLNLFMQKVMLDYWRDRPDTPEDIAITTIPVHVLGVDDPVCTNREAFPGIIVAEFRSKINNQKYFVVEHVGGENIMHVFPEHQLTYRGWEPITRYNLV